MMKRSQFAGLFRRVLVSATLVCAVAGGAMAQSSGTSKAPASTSDEYGYSKFDITPFVGWQWFQAFQGDNTRNYAERYKSGWLFGERFNADFTPKVSAEASMVLGSNRLIFLPAGQTSATASIGAKNLQVALDIVYQISHERRRTDFSFWPVRQSSGTSRAVPRGPTPSVILSSQCFLSKRSPSRVSRMELD